MYEGLSVETSCGNQAQDYLAGMHGLSAMRIGLSDQGLYHACSDSADEGEFAAVGFGCGGDIFGLCADGEGYGSLEYVFDGSGLPPPL